MATPAYRYAELHAHSAFSFRYGADLPQTMIQRASELGLEGIGILDYDGMYGAVQCATAAKEYPISTIYGTEIRLPDGTHLPILARNVEGYHRLCSLISSVQLQRESKTETVIDLDTLGQWNKGDWVILTGTRHGPLIRARCRNGMDGVHACLNELTARFGRENVVVESCLSASFSDFTREVHPGLDLAVADDADFYAEAARSHQLTLVATTAAVAADVTALRRAQVLRAIKLRATLDQVYPYLEAAGAVLRSASQMLKLHHRHPQAVANAAALGREIAFDLKLIAPRLPRSITPEGKDDDTWLRECTYAGALRKYGTAEDSPRAWEVIESELELINRLGFSGYFLIVKDIVEFCQAHRILCQGRGSAANSAVCYCLGITAVDAVKHKMLFSRFLSPDRAEPPDIDLDIEAVRREEVIAYVYRKYGRNNAAQVANVITYRHRSAITDCGRALGYDEAVVKRWASGNYESPPGLVTELAQQLKQLPRHLGIHSGGMVLSERPVSEICPVQWAAKAGRTVVQWDKDDCAEVGLVKFDLLGLGMLTALREMFRSASERGAVGTDGEPLDLYNLPQDDPRVYDLLCAADTVGVFQVESRAQMNTLPRLQPRCFYDIVVAVALIRPGPIQGQAVHPYLRRRLGKEAITYDHPLLRPIVERTAGVAVFQEQLMEIAMKVAGFDAVQADHLRKAMGSKRSVEKMAKLKPQFYAGLADNGITGSVADRIFAAFQGFSEFGFPESHAFSFAYIVYASAWMKVHYPCEFYVGLLNAQPMGFYSPATLVADARRHGLIVERADVAHSQAQAQVESATRLRLGLSSIRHLSSNTVERILQARRDQRFMELEDLARTAVLSTHEVELLSRAGACAGLGIQRRQGQWQAGLVGQEDERQPTLPGLRWPHHPLLPQMNRAEVLLADQCSTGLSTRDHPIALIRPRLRQKQILSCRQVGPQYAQRRVQVAGLVTHRQRPHTAKGTVFLSFEDETGLLNVICSAGVWQRYRRVAVSYQALIVRGVVEYSDQVSAIVADCLEPLVELDESLHRPARDFR